MKYIPFIIIILCTIKLTGCDSAADINQDKDSMATITLSASATNLTIGDLRSTTVTGTDTNGNTHDLKDSVSWKVANPNIIGIDKKRLYAKATGTTTVKVVYENKSNVVTSNILTITVTSKQIRCGFLNGYSDKLVAEIWVGESLSYKNGKVYAKGVARKVILDDDIIFQGVTDFDFAINSVTEQKNMLLILGVKDNDTDGNFFYLTHKLVTELPEVFSLDMDSNGYIH